MIQNGDYFSRLNTEYIQESWIIKTLKRFKIQL